MVGTVRMTTILCVFLVWSAIAQGVERLSIWNAPELDNGHDVQFFLLETSFPYNAPEDIRVMAGEIFQEYYNMHGALGVWDVTSNVKFSIEFISESYVGALLPGFDEDTGKLVWSNAGQIWVTTPTEEASWHSAQLVCATTGVLYNQLVTYIQDNMDRFTYFQPVDVVWYNATQITSAQSGRTELGVTGNVQLANRESFWFVNELVNKLSTYGGTVNSYLTLYAASYQYLTPIQEAPAVVQWSANGPADADVYHWYQQLANCYSDRFAEASDSKAGGQHFIELLKGCYGSYAYIYASDSSVYNVTLANYTRLNSTPKLTRHVMTLLDDGTANTQDLQPVDYVLVALVFLALVVGVGYLLSRICSRPRRRKVSMEGEKVASRVVEGTGGAGEVGDGFAVSANDEVQEYYRSKSVDTPVTSRMMYNMTGGLLGALPSQRDLQNIEVAKSAKLRSSFSLTGLLPSGVLNSSSSSSKGAGGGGGSSSQRYGSAGAGAEGSEMVSTSRPDSPAGASSSGLQQGDQV